MSPTVHFGAAELRPSERRLLVDGKPVAVGARAFDVLQLLIACRDRVVGKSELLERVWPGLVVEENNLQVQISTLRKILGASAITTVPGLGYQFTAPLDGGREAAPAEPVQPDPPAPQAPVPAVAQPRPPWRERWRWPAFASVAALVAALAVGAAVWGRWHQEPVPLALPATPTASAHSVAVLPFVNLSGDPSQEYFTDGLSEELLNSLASVPDLRVAARTSSFSFRGEKVQIAEVARKLNVRAVLEGSVRRDGNKVRITAQLSDAGTGYLLWSQSYDRELRDILPLQSEIATAVTQALQATLLADALQTIELGGTQNPNALDAYLRGMRWNGNKHTLQDHEACIAEFTQAIALDPRFARAYARQATALYLSAALVPAPQVHATYERARAAAQQALAVAPALGMAHGALAGVLEDGYFDFAGAAVEWDRAVALAPGDAFVLGKAAIHYADAGRVDEALALTRRALALDPLSANAHYQAGYTLLRAQRLREAIGEFDHVLNLNPQYDGASAQRGLALSALGELEAARDSCEAPPVHWIGHYCLALVHDQLHDHGAAARDFAALQAESGDTAAYQFAQIYAHWGDTARALDWLETAYRLRDPGLVGLRNDREMAPLRQLPRYQAVEHQLQFPN